MKVNLSLANSMLNGYFHTLMKTVVNRTGKVFYYFIELVFAFVAFYFIVFFGGGLFGFGELQEDGVKIYVKSNGVHTDICLPVKTPFYDWTALIPSEDFGNVKQLKYVSIGWGDKGFFLDTPEWSDLTFSTAVNAAFLNSGTAMHVAYFSNDLLHSESCKTLFISEEQYSKLIKYIEGSFTLKDNKAVLIPGRGYWSNDNFYEANGNYHLFETCNRWTNKALKLVNVKTGLFALSADGIMMHLSK